MHRGHPFLATVLCAGLLLCSTAPPAAITYSGEQRNASGAFGSSGASADQQRRSGNMARERSERHLRHPLQTSPDRNRNYYRDRFRDGSRDGYRDGYRSGFRDGYRHDDGGYRSPYGYRGPRYGYGYPRPPGGMAPYGYSPYSGGAPGYSPPPVRRYPSVPQPLSPYRR